ncbi:hypothetical protein WG66_009839 [Moniliophthora roreri]|nr:hypothetical protein WG66_009839 [Moniliophthora roreri]
MKFLEPLFFSIVEDPDQRPSARECSAMFEKLIHNLSRGRLLGMRRGNYEEYSCLERVMDQIMRNIKGRADHLRLVVKAIVLNRGRSF